MIFKNVGIVIFMALVPGYVWVEGRIFDLLEEKQYDRIPKWLDWIDYLYDFYEQRGMLTSKRRRKLTVLLIGIPLPLIVLIVPSPIYPSPYRLIIVAISFILFGFCIAIFEWLIRSR